ncbi:hypothetical protein, conserved in T. vivax [Trypanosoma vivax Y486]|uniref:Uncharacterized protein n=1 Tax=Trypanosoma vivax (strain Y486) TaxID=1055687 RepID=F9WNZ5_TRYVY|nr:hypothetical protein, conserved in T. vivax [Trypanosoma vivax Y486]|eukprot:CCD19267.1 hypothetical protein, conserved in T. vivax [Trypanosoma vivax Y486]
MMTALCFHLSYIVSRRHSCLLTHTFVKLKVRLPGGCLEGVIRAGYWWHLISRVSAGCCFVSLNCCNHLFRVRVPPHRHERHDPGTQHDSRNGDGEHKIGGCHPTALHVAVLPRSLHRQVNQLTVAFLRNNHVTTVSGFQDRLRFIGGSAVSCSWLERRISRRPRRTSAFLLYFALDFLHLCLQLDALLLFVALLFRCLVCRENSFALGHLFIYNFHCGNSNSFLCLDQLTLRIREMKNNCLYVDSRAANKILEVLLKSSKLVVPLVVTQELRRYFTADLFQLLFLFSPPAVQF